MEKYKFIVDILSSTAALIAIVTVLISWYRNIQKPLSIRRIIIHKDSESSTYIIGVKNKKTYPVQIKSVDCHKHKNFKVEKMKGYTATYQETLGLEDLVFSNSDKFEIGASGNSDIKITGSSIPNRIQKLLLTLNTSHGYHQIWCKDILVTEIGKVRVYGVEHSFKYYSKLKAIFRYVYLRVSSFIKSSS